MRSAADRSRSGCTVRSLLATMPAWLRPPGGAGNLLVEQVRHWHSACRQNELRSWRLQHRTGSTLTDLARRINPVVAGWLNYYGRYGRWVLIPFLQRINAYLVRWIRRKYRRLAPLRRAIAKFQEIAQRYPRMFAHWPDTTLAALAW